MGTSTTQPDANVSPEKLLRWAGLLTWVVAAAPETLALARGELTWSSRQLVLWVLALSSFLVAYIFSTRAPLRAEDRGRLWGLLVQTAASSSVVALEGFGIAGVLFVVVASQLPGLVRMRTAVIWVLGHAAIMFALYTLRATPIRGVVLAGAFLGFQLFALAIAELAARESRARRELAKVNAELMATGLMLAESGRIAERMRIAQDLHDTLGHHLAALSLQLEIAAQHAEGKIAEPIHLAGTLTKRLLMDVKHVVTAVRVEPGWDLVQAFQTLAAGIPRPKTHFAIPGQFSLKEPRAALAMFRCVQEIITNALKHADADNLWIELHVDPDRVVVRARDDGRGAAHIAPGGGLTGMRERFEELGGRVEVTATVDRGVSVLAWIPCNGDRIDRRGIGG
jgi:signal transduction histidine kinase